MIQYFSWNADGRLEVVNENGTIIFTNEDTYMVDRHGNTFTINDLQATFQQNSHTYEELYEHWLKTKQND